MKKLILIFSVLAFALIGNAQSTITDTIKGANTVNFTAMQRARTVVATCSNVGGVADGTLTLQGSFNGTTFYPISFNGGLGATAPYTSIPAADSVDRVSVTIDSSLVATWSINNRNYPFHRLQGVGTSGDTTKVIIRWWK